MLGVTFDGIEDKVMELLEEIERRMREKKLREATMLKGKRKSRKEGCRELKRLQSLVNYDFMKKNNKNEGISGKIVK